MVITTGKNSMVKGPSVAAPIVSVDFVVFFPERGLVFLLIDVFFVVVKRAFKPGGNGNWLFISCFVQPSFFPILVTIALLDQIFLSDCFQIDYRLA